MGVRSLNDLLKEDQIFYVKGGSFPLAVQTEFRKLPATKYQASSENARTLYTSTVSGNKIYVKTLAPRSELLQSLK